MQSDVVFGENKLEMTRFFGYPREAVFAAWTESNQLDKWWGCRDTVSVKSDMDLVVGGEFKHVMQHRLAGEMVVSGVYDEIIPPERIVTSTVMGAGTDYAFKSTTTVDFVEQEGGTLIRLTQVGLPPMPDACTIISGGMNDAFEKLERHLAG